MFTNKEYTTTEVVEVLWMFEFSSKERAPYVLTDNGSERLPATNVLPVFYTGGPSDLKESELVNFIDSIAPIGEEKITAIRIPEMWRDHGLGAGLKKIDNGNWVRISKLD